MWTRAAAAQLAQRCADAPAGEGGWRERWDVALDGAPAGVRRLADELLVVHLLFPTDVSAAAKRAVVGELDPELDAALALGVAPGGRAFTLLRLSQLRWLARFAAAWVDASAEERAAAIADAGAFAELVDAVPADGGGPQRAALKHLVHPDAFEPIVSADLRRRIARWAEELTGHPAADADGALRAARAALAGEHSPHFSFLDGPVAELWRG